MVTDKVSYVIDKRGESSMEFRHHKFNRITLDPDKCFGKPCIRELRMPVANEI